MNRAAGYERVFKVHEQDSALAHGLSEKRLAASDGERHLHRQWRLPDAGIADQDVDGGGRNEPVDQEVGCLAICEPGVPGRRRGAFRIAW